MQREFTLPLPITLFSSTILLLTYGSGAVTYLGTSESALKPVYLHAAVAIFGILCLVFRPAPLSGVRAYRHLFAAMALYIAMLVAWASVGQVIDIRVLYNRLLFVLIFFFAGLTFHSTGRFQSLINVFRVVVFGMCALNLAEMIFGFSLFPLAIEGRASGLLGHANNVAVSIGFALPLTIISAKRIVALFWYAVTLLGILPTFSREGMILWAAGVALTLLAPPGKPIGVQQIFRLVFVAALGLAVAWNYIAIMHWAAQILAPFLNKDTARRLTELHDDAAQERIYLIKLAWTWFTEHALFGSGIGICYHWGYPHPVHNQVLMTMDEQGLVGAAWISYFIFALFCLRMPVGLYLGMLFFLSVMFMPQIFDYPNVAVMFALYCRWTEWLTQSGRRRPDAAALINHPHQSRAIAAISSSAPPQFLS